MTTSWLIDKSALVRLGSSVDAEEWAQRIERGLVAISTVTVLEAGFSARPSRSGPSRCKGCWPNAAGTVLLQFPICWSPPAPNSISASSSTSTRTSTSSPTSLVKRWNASASPDPGSAVDHVVIGVV